MKKLLTLVLAAGILTVTSFGCDKGGSTKATGATQATKGSGMQEKKETKAS